MSTDDTTDFDLSDFEDDAVMRTVLSLKGNDFETEFERRERERPDPCDHLYEYNFGKSTYARLSKVFDWLYLGDDIYIHDPVEKAKMKNAGVTHVLDCRTQAEITMGRRSKFYTQPERTFRYRTNPTNDDGARKSPAYFAKGIEAGRRAVEEGGVLYVHCAMGINRGPSNAYAIMRALDPELDTVGALTAIRTARPFAAVLYWRDADDAIAELYGR